jgi:hypothetical protein
MKAGRYFLANSRSPGHADSLQVFPAFLGDRERAFFIGLFILTNFFFTAIITLLFLHHDVFYHQIPALMGAILGILLWVTAGAPMVLNLIKEDED